jgi:hypothetical protein
VLLLKAHGDLTQHIKIIKIVKELDVVLNVFIGDFKTDFMSIKSESLQISLQIQHPGV